MKAMLLFTLVGVVKSLYLVLESNYFEKNIQIFVIENVLKVEDVNAHKCIHGYLDGDIICPFIIQYI